MNKEVRSVYGPYIRKDGRAHVIIIYQDKSRRTVSYPKYLMEQHLGRILSRDETTDHIDEDFTNNDLSNLRIKSKSQHAKDDVRRAKLFQIICVYCGTKAFKEGRNLRGNADKGKAGPFCNRSCAGAYGSDVKNGKVNILPPQNNPGDSEYYKTRTYS